MNNIQLAKAIKVIQKVNAKKDYPRFAREYLWITNKAGEKVRLVQNKSQQKINAIIEDLKLLWCDVSDVTQDMGECVTVRVVSHRFDSPAHTRKRRLVFRDIGYRPEREPTRDFDGLVHRISAFRYFVVDLLNRDIQVFREPEEQVIYLVCRDLRWIDLDGE